MKKINMLKRALMIIGFIGIFLSFTFKTYGQIIPTTYPKDMYADHSVSEYYFTIPTNIYYVSPVNILVDEVYYGFPDGHSGGSSLFSIYDVTNGQSIEMYFTHGGRNVSGSFYPQLGHTYKASLFSYRDTTYCTATITYTTYQITDTSPPNPPSLSLETVSGSQIVPGTVCLHTNSNPANIVWVNPADPPTSDSISTGVYLFRVNNNGIYNYQYADSYRNTYSITTEGIYTIQVQAIDNAGYYSNWSTIYVATDYSVAKPSLGSIQINSQLQPNGSILNNITLNWNPVTTDVSGIGHYEVAISNRSDTPLDSEINKSISASTTQYTFTKPNSVDQNSPLWYIYVKAVDVLGNGASNTANSWTQSGAIRLYSPSTSFGSLVPTANLQNGRPAYSIKLPINNVNAYQYIIKRLKVGSSSFVPIATLTQAQLAASNFTYTDTNNLEAHAQYTYYIYTQSSQGVISNTTPSDIAAIPNIPATFNVMNGDGLPVPNQVFINQNTYTFQLNPTQDSENDQLKFRVLGDCGSQSINTGDSNNLQSGPLTLTFPSEGSWSCRLEVGEFVNGIELSGIDYLRQLTTPKVIIYDQTPPLASVNSFSIKSLTGNTTYDSGNNPTNTRDVLLSDINLYDNGSGIKELYFWNGDSSTRPSDAIHKAINEANPDITSWKLPDIGFTLSDGDGLKTVTMQVIDNAGNATLITYQVKLDTHSPVAPDITTFSHIFSDDGILFKWQADNTNGDLTMFHGQYTLPDGTIHDFKPFSANADGTGSIDIPVSAGSNLPVTIQVMSVDRAGNKSIAVIYTAYTKADLGTLQDLTSGYDSGSQQFYLKWRIIPGQGAQAYILEYDKATDQSFTVDGTINPVGDIFTHTGLLPHGEYQYRLVAINNSGDRTEGEPFKRPVPNTAPTEPVLQSPLTYTRGDIEFKYSPAMDFDGDGITYHIYLKRDNDSIFSEVSDNISGLIDGQSYVWYVEAEDTCHVSTRSQTGQFTVDNQAPTLTVESVRAPYTNQSQLSMTVNDNVSGIEEISYCMIDSASTQVVADGNVDLNTGIIKLAEGCYHLHLTALDKAGNSALVELNNLKVDQTDPLLTMTSLDLSQNAGKYLTGTGKLPVHFDAEDSFSGISSLRYWILENRNDQLGTGKTVLLSPNLAHFSQILELNGATGKEYYLAMAVEDAAGNRSVISYLGPIILDLTPPQVGLTISGFKNQGSGNYLANINQLSVATSVADPESGIKQTQLAILSLDTGNPVNGWGDWDMITQADLRAGNKYKIVMKSTNQVGLAAVTQSDDFTFDNTEPQNLKITGPNTSNLTPGETVSFTVAAEEPESALIEYRLALVKDGTEAEKLTAQVAGNDEGWLISRSGGSQVQFRFEIPSGVTGSYHPVLQVTNAAGLQNSITGNSYILDVNQAKLVVNDQGPYTMFSDHLTGWWKYLGRQTVTEYRYRIIDKHDQVITDWQSTQETSVNVSGLRLISGEQYFYQVEANLGNGKTSSGTSFGVTVDASLPEIVKLTTPEYTTSDNLRFQWEAADAESGIDRVWVALGSDYYQNDVTGGWVEVHGNPVQLTVKANGEPLNLETGHRYYLTLRVSNGAGLQTEKAASSIMVDNTPPPVPVITTQGSYINPAKQPVTANWIWTPAETESGPVKYEWAFIPQGGDLSSATWNPVGQITKAMVNNPNLADGSTYYFAVKSTNQAGLTSIGYSSGIVMDSTAPIIPEVTLLQAINLSEDKEAVYITNISNLKLNINSYDLNGINVYNYTYGIPTEISQNIDYRSSNIPVFPVNPTIEKDQITIFKSICSDGAVNLSQPGYSSGVVLDDNAPKIINVHGSISGNNLLFDWDVEASVSPVIYYEYALVPEAQMNAAPANWTKADLKRSIVIDGKNLADGNYRLLIRGCNAAGSYSRRQGDINEWGISPRITLDRQPPIMDAAQFNYPLYANEQIATTIAAQDSLSGIGGYQYALGTKTNPWLYTEGWVDVAEKTGLIQVNVPTNKVEHNTEVYLMVRAKDNVGLWSGALVSRKILIDHTLPTTPVVTSGQYSTSKIQISDISYQSVDPESNLTHYRLGIVTEPGQPWLTMNQATIDNFDGRLTGLNLAEAGTYYIGLQTRNGAGDWSQIGYSQAVTVDTISPTLMFTKGDRIIVLNAPPLDIQYTLTEPANIEFTLTGADGGSKTFTVTGQTGTNNFNFTENKPQIYQLSAILRDPAGNAGNTAVQLIRVNAPPQITLPAEFNTTPGAKLPLTADVFDPDGTPAGYSWDPGDGGGLLTGATPEYRYYKLGTYTLSLTVVDNDGGISTKTTVVNVGNTTKGRLWVDETWSGTHYIYGDVTVPAGITLTILPGTRIIVDKDFVTGAIYTLDIQGTLIARGAGITFCSITGQDNSWKGIYLEGTATLDQVAIQDAERGLTIINNATATISNCTFGNNLVGIHVYGSKPVISDSLFLNNIIYGIKEDEGGRPVVTGCQFSGNGMNYYSEESTELTMDQLNQIEGNSGNR